MKDRSAILLLILVGSLHGALFIWANAHYTTLSADMAIIGGFLHNFSHSLLDGTPYPRWLGGQFNGTGAPVFIIYSPLAFYIGSVFTLPKGSDPFGVYQLGLAMDLGVICASLTSYLWLRRHTSVGMSTFLAIVLLVVPNRFLLMQIQTGLAGIWATVWFPLALYSVERWHESKDRSFLAVFSLMLALIVLTHTPSAVLFLPLLGLYGCFYRTADLKTIGGLFIAFALALGLTSIYLIPAWLNRPAISFTDYLGFITDYNVSFLTIDSVLFYFIPKILMDAFPFVMLALVSLWFARPGSAKERLGNVIRLFGLIILAASLLFTPVTKALWEQSALLHWLQAPFRFLALFFVLSPVLLVWISQQLKIPVLVVLVLIFLVPPGWRAWEDYSVRRDISSTSNAQSIVEKTLTSQSAATEYKTIWMPGKLKAPGDFTGAYASIAPAAFIEGDGSIKVLTWQDERIVLHIDTAASATLRLRQNYFPAWESFIGKNKVSTHPDPLGLMLVDVPAGTNDLEIKFSALPGMITGAWLSLTSLLALIGMCFTGTKKGEMAPPL